MDPKNRFDIVEDFVFMPVREYMGIDMDGQIAIPRNEIHQRLKEICDAYSNPDFDSARDCGLFAR
ncbi:MAG: hypothetical protein WCA15_10245 [Candidatus Acidiferrales bacterium]